MNRKCGILYLIRDLMPKNILINLYYSIVYPHILYCNLIWGNTYASHLKPLVIAQKRIVKTLTFKPKSFSSVILFKDINLLNINQLNKYSLCIFVFKNLHGIQDDIVFENSRINQHYNVRDQYKLSLPSSGSTQSQKSVEYSAVSIWNSLPVHLRTINTISSLKKHLKEFLISVP